MYKKIVFKNVPSKHWGYIGGILHENPEQLEGVKQGNRKFLKIINFESEGLLRIYKTKTQLVVEWIK